MTSGQRDQIVRLFKDGAEWALDEVVDDEFTQDEVQRIVMRGGELCAGFPELLRVLAKGRYANEEVQSNYGYSSGYQKPVLITDQIDILRQNWPKLNPDQAIKYWREVYPTLRFPDWVEGPFAIIRPEFFSNVYGEELEEVLKALADDRNGAFYNWRASQLGSKHLRQSEHTLSKLRVLVERQPGSDILVCASQLGIRHSGRSVRRVREIYAPVEYGETAKNGCTMVLTNPNRLMNYDDLWLDFPGDEFSDGGRLFDRAPCLRFFVRAEFGSLDVSYAVGRYGSVSSALPQ